MSTATVAQAACEVRSMLDGAQPSGEDLWRFGVLQLLDDYETLKRHQGVPAAAGVLAGEPPRTGHSGVDASFAALACWLATTTSSGSRAILRIFFANANHLHDRNQLIKTRPASSIRPLAAMRDMGKTVSAD